MVSLMHQLLYARQKWAQYLLNRKQDGPQSWSGHCEGGEQKFLPLLEFDSQIVQPVQPKPTLVSLLMHEQ